VLGGGEFTSWRFYNRYGSAQRGRSRDFCRRSRSRKACPTNRQNQASECGKQTVHATKFGTTRLEWSNACVTAYYVGCLAFKQQLVITQESRAKQSCSAHPNAADYNVRHTTQGMRGGEQLRNRDLQKELLFWNWKKVPGCRVSAFKKTC
jgi:hypothetical protein